MSILCHSFFHHIFHLFFILNSQYFPASNVTSVSLSTPNFSGYYRNLDFPESGNETSRKNSPLWELLPSNFSWSPIGSRQSNWLANCREACKYDKLERQYKCVARDNYVRIWYWTLLGWTSSDHGDHHDVSFPLSWNRGYDSNRRHSLTSFHETSKINSPLWECYSIPPVREAMGSLYQFTLAR